MNYSINIIYKFLIYIFVVLFFNSCAIKNLQTSLSAVVIFKTPFMKFYDKGFINKYDNYINLQIYNSGNLALNLNIYKDEVCKSTFECMSSNEFNKKYADKLAYLKGFRMNIKN